MKLLREYIRDLLIEQEEGRSELDKIKEVFISNGKQAVELADMLGLGDDPAVKGMKLVLEVAVGYLDVITNRHPDPMGVGRLEGWSSTLTKNIYDIYSKRQGTERNSYTLITPGGKEIYDRFSEVLKYHKGRSSLEQAEMHINDLAKWSGHPVELPAEKRV